MRVNSEQMSQDKEATDTSIINIFGEKVALGMLRRDLLPLYQKWINHFEVVVTLARKNISYDV